MNDMLHLRTLLHSIPEAVVIIDRIEFTAKRNLGIWCQLFSHNCFHTSCHIDGRSTIIIQTISYWRWALVLGRLKSQPITVDARISEGLFIFAMLQPATRLTFLFTIYVPVLPLSYSQVIHIQCIIRCEGCYTFAKLISVHARNSHMNVLIAEEIIIRFDYALNSLCVLTSDCVLVANGLIVGQSKATLIIKLDMTQRIVKYTTSSVQLSASWYTERPTIALNKLLSCCLKI